MVLTLPSHDVQNQLYLRLGDFNTAFDLDSSNMDVADLKKFKNHQVELRCFVDVPIFLSTGIRCWVQHD